MNASETVKTKPSLPDFSLLISGLEKEILNNADPARALRVLKNEQIWSGLDLAQKLKWADMSQMAGDPDTACRIFDHLNRTSPQCLEGWRAHLDLLRILDRKSEIARVLALSRGFLDEAQYRDLLKEFGESQPKRIEDDFRETSAPFESLRYRRQLLAKYLDLFSGREDCFARQWVDRDSSKQGYVPVRRPIEPGDLEEHLKGLKTYGIYLMRSDGTVKTAVIDVDLRKEFRGRKLTSDDKAIIKRELNYVIVRLYELASDSGLQPLLEFSGGKGYHFWFFFDEPAAPEKVRAALEILKKKVSGDLSAFNIEVFPKQDHLKEKGFGNLVKLPLGVHRLTGKRSYFLKCHDRSVDAQLSFLLKFSLSSSGKLEAVRNADMAERVVLHPKWEKWAESFPELFELESRCPPLGQIIAVCRNAKGLSVREEKILFQTVGFLPRAKTLLHHLMSGNSDYNPHSVDYRLSLVRGTPLGCRRIHSLLNYVGDYCRTDASADYQHPLLHLDESLRGKEKISEKAENLSSAVANLKAAIIQLERFIK